MPRRAMASKSLVNPDLQSTEHSSTSESATAFYRDTKDEEAFIANLLDYYLQMTEKWEIIAEHLNLKDFAAINCAEANLSATEKLDLVLREWLKAVPRQTTIKDMLEELQEVLKIALLPELATTIKQEFLTEQPQSSEEVVKAPRPSSTRSQPEFQSPQGSPSRMYSLRSSPLTQQTNYRFAIMVANDNEEHATMHFLGSTDPWLKEKIGKRVKRYTFEGDKKLRNEIVIGPERFLDYVPISVGKAPGVLVRCSDIGSFRPSGSHRTTLQLIKNASDEHWDLEMIFIVGCCGTCPEPAKIEEEVDLDPPPSKRVKQSQTKNKKPNEIVPIGTVLFAQEIFQYAMGKLTDDIPVWIPTIMCCPPAVNFKAVQYSDASRVVKKVEPASFLSADFVVKGENTARKLKDLHQNQKYVGFEMEGVGAKKATSDAEIFLPLVKIPKVLLVKGVSDKAGGEKNKPCPIQFFPKKPIANVDEDSRQQMCTISSLTMVLRYIIQFKAKSWLPSK